MANTNKEPLEFTTTDAESEEDVSQGLAQQVAKAVLWSTDWTVETIYRQLEKGNIELNPEFQRREAWNDKKKSLFIESLFLGFPIPQIVLAERKDKPGSYIVIDGKQRLLTIRRFCAKKNDEDFKPFTLQGLNIRSEFNGLTYEEITANPKCSNDVRFFENQTFRTTITKADLDATFLNTLNSYGQSRGISAHQSIKAQQPIDPVTELKMVDDLIGEIQKLDLILQALID